MKQSNRLLFKPTITIVALLLISSATNGSVIKKLASQFKDHNNVIGDLAKMYNQFDELSGQGEEASATTPFRDIHENNQSAAHSVPQLHNGHFELEETVSSYEKYVDDETPIDNKNDNPDALIINYEEDPTYSSKRKHESERIDPNVKDNRTPVWGVLTEPIGGTLQAGSVNVGYDEYVPAAVVKFIEQTGAKVVPVSYKLTRSSLVKLLDQLSGLYLPGDSAASLPSHEYQATFSYIISYIFHRSDVKYDYFPVFMMGNSLQSLVLNRLGSTTILKSISPMSQHNIGLRLTMNPTETYLFDELESTTVNEFLQDARVFNKQRMGLRVRDFLRESKINKRYQVIATFKTSGAPLGDAKIVDEEEFVACLESPDFPLYVCTYEPQYTQFIHADPSLTTTDPLDHTVASRKHAQFFAKQIADEGRISQHAFKSKSEIFPRLIRHQELAKVEYTSISGDSSQPKGLEIQEFYLVK